MSGQPRTGSAATTGWSLWITPTFAPKRFDTWFFLAEAPEDQIALHDGSESVDSVWIGPTEAIDEATAGKRTLVHATLKNLELLAEEKTVAGALAASLHAEKVIYLTDVPGLLEDVADPGSLIRTATVSELRRKMADGELTGGMIPKIDAAVSAVEHGVPAAHLLDGRLDRRPSPLDARRRTSLESPLVRTDASDRMVLS